MSRRRGRSAALPHPGYEPHQVVADDGLEVSLALEDGQRVVDLRDWRGSDESKRQAAAAILRWSQHGLRRTSSVKTRMNHVKAFLAWLDEQQIAALTDLTVADLRAYRMHLRATRGPVSAFGYYNGVCVLLQHAQGLSEALEKRVRERRGSQPRASDGPMPKYTKAEMKQLRRDTKRVIVRMHARISESVQRAEGVHDPDLSPDEAAAALALHETIQYGKPQSMAGFAALGAVSEYHGTLPVKYADGSVRDRPTVQRQGLLKTVREMVFPTHQEAYAMTVWLAIVGSYNKSVVETMTVPSMPGNGVVQMALDKPRRGAAARYWAEMFDGKNGEVIRKIIEATQPLRDHATQQGQSTDRLIGFYQHREGVKFSIPAVEKWTTGKPAWLPLDEDDNHVPVLFPRLRRSTGVIEKEPTHHDDDTNLAYIRRDADALRRHQEQARDGIARAMRTATGLMRIIVAESDADAPGPDHDTVAATCLDVHHHPDTGRPCSNGYFGFLLCLFCSNAVSVPRKLPWQVATLIVLDDLRNGMPEEQWDRRFAKPYFAMRALVRDHRSETEIEHANRVVTDDMLQTIRNALGGQS